MVKEYEISGSTLVGNYSHTLAGSAILNWLVVEEMLNDASRNAFAQLREIMDLSEITGAYTYA